MAEPGGEKVIRPERSGVEWTAEQVRRVGYEVVDLMAEHLTTAKTGPVFRPVPAAVAERLRSGEAPRVGMEPGDVLREFRETIMPYPLGNGHPRFWAWVCSPPNVMAVFGEALAAAMNPHCDVGNHAASHLERQVTGWFADMVGFPASAKGILVSGGSMANLTGLTVARHAKLGPDVRRDGLQAVDRPLVAYVSTEGHSCLRKAFELLGIGSANVRVISTDDAFRMRLADLETQIVVDIAEGYQPFVVVASAGATNTGAIDPLRDISAIAKRHGLWLHVDGSYGAPAILADEYREELSGLALADSIAIDPHKWLQVPVEAGLALVKDAELMRDAFSLVPPYLRQDGGEDGVGGPTSYAEYGFQQTRGFRALKIWMMVKHVGMDRIAAMIEQNIELARLLDERIRRTPGLEVVTPRSLSVVDFRAVPAALRGDPERLNAFNRALVERIQLGGDAFLGGTLVRGVACIRACIVNYLARESDVAIVVDAVQREADALLPQFVGVEAEATLYDVAAHAMARGEPWGVALDGSDSK